MVGEKIKDKAKQYKKGGKPTHRKERTINSDFDIIAQYQSEFRGFAQYYLIAYNAHQLHSLKRTMEVSLARTLANKFKTTANKMFKKYKMTRETDGQSYKVLQTEVKREGKKPLVAFFGGFKLGYKKDAIIVDAPPTGKVFSIKSQLIDRLLNDTCELCGAKGNIEMHHIKKQKDLENNGRTDKPEWMKRMIAMRRKTLAVAADQLEAEVAVAEEVVDHQIDQDLTPAASDRIQEEEIETQMAELEAIAENEEPEEEISEEELNLLLGKQEDQSIPGGDAEMSQIDRDFEEIEKMINEELDEDLIDQKALNDVVDMLIEEEEKAKKEAKDEKNIDELLPM
ncbi:group II intron reverse transcriptase/maturase [Paenibacillus sp. LHD-38]|uniref:HNH endonuclease n=1 Tax=Paenibacillus sp. LHD-38 TaxID=3072143 RepID=UPI00280CDFC2|nr:group II intron reverse transcriptase/maturase [Paenibacillus sp. LHD-38]MDQ8736406.1 group II intron reverse transcriptase/maturase [Paenibacillus sp. LHD-38]